MKWFRLFDTQSQLEKSLGATGRKIVRIGDKKICLFLHEGTFYAFDNLCPHNMHSLFEGKINYLNEVVCPLHGYRYNLKDGRECEARSGDLVIHRLDIAADGVFLGLNS